MKNARVVITDLFKRLGAVLGDALSAFGRNNDLSAASSLAFSATLALIPALLLLTVLLGTAIGSSAQALRETEELLKQLIPAYSQVVMREVGVITSHKGAIGIVNLLVLFLSITPLAADLRTSLGTIFWEKPHTSFLRGKLVDVVVSLLFLAGISAVTAAGVMLTVVGRFRPLQLLSGRLEAAAFFLLVTGVSFALYYVFSPHVRLRSLMKGALAAAVLWFAMRPAFQLFLAYNPGYGFAFGSFKSLFVVIIWIYFSLVVFLIGAEIAASIVRNESRDINKIRSL